MTYVVQGCATVANGDDLEGRLCAVSNVEVDGKFEFWNADGAVARLVEQHGVE